METTLAAETIGQASLELVRIGDFLVDPETGEVHEVVPPRPEFHVTDDASANWVLDKIGQLEGERMGLESRLASAIERLQSEIARKQRGVERLKARFGAELEEYARRQLAGGKSKTLKLDMGALSFRTQPVRLRIREGVETRYSYSATGTVIERPPLIEWALSDGCGLVKVTEEYQISTLPKGTTIDNLPAHLFEQTEPLEKFTIDTGIGK